jgi:hypothetical protein
MSMSSPERAIHKVTASVRAYDQRVISRVRTALANFQRRPLLPRFNFVEIEDQIWCPGSLRDAITDTLRFVFSLAGLYRPIIPYLHRALRHSEAKEVIDLCSGSGGPWLGLCRALWERHHLHIRVRLTDKYPNKDALERVSRASERRIVVHPDPVDAVSIGKHLNGFRTMFTCFHHFRPEQARTILRDAVQSHQGIGIFEVPQRSLLAILLTLLMPVAAFAFAPFILPFRWSRLFWTYVVPLAPVAVLCDGLVSCLRSYSVDELAGLAEGLAHSGYHWEVGETRRGISPIPVTFLIGWPDKTAGPSNFCAAGHTANEIFVDSR